MTVPFASHASMLFTETTHPSSIFHINDEDVCTDIAVCINHEETYAFIKAVTEFIFTPII